MNRSILLLAANLLALLASALTVEVQVFRHSYCGRESGYAMANVFGGVPPYTYEWGVGNCVDFSCGGLIAGTYTLIVTDALMDQASTSFTIDLLPGYGYVGQFNGMARCAGDPAIVATFPVEPVYDPTGMAGPPPFNFNSAEVAITGQVQTNECQSFGATFYETLRFDGAAPGTYTVSFSDGNACAGTIDVVIPPALIALPEVQPVNVIPSCASPGTGSITFSFEGLTQYEYRVLLKPDGVADDCAPQVGTQWIGPNTASGTRTFSGLLPGDYWLVTSTDADRWFSGTPWSDAACKDSILVTVPSLGTDCGVLSGRVYIDDDADCVRDGTENSVPATIVEITPGPYFVTTSSTGQYSIGLNYGTYTITEQNPVFDQSCGATATLASAGQTVNVGCAGGEPLDVQLAMANGPARPGFQLEYGIDLDNLTPASTGAVTLTVTLDPVLGFLSANPAPATVAGNVVTWNLSMTQVFQHVDVSVRTQVPPDVGLIGTTFTTTALVTTANTDGNLSNNSATSNQLVTGSYDPNDKRAFTSTGGTSVWTINEDQWIDYIIRFQNTGTDTAFNVVITDTLPATLDPATITWGAGSHAHSRALVGQGVLTFIFPNILLPDSNVNEPLSHGFVGFRIRPRLPVLPGTEIINIANIYFDFNPPIITEPSVLVAELSTGVGEGRAAGLSVWPIPTSDVVHITATSVMRSVRILSLDGSEAARYAVNASSTALDLSALHSGSYLLISELVDGSQAHQRITKL
jgi:uncharacterized repeat protein (TIGR01451 family)